MDKDNASLHAATPKTAFGPFSRALQTPPSLENLIRPLAGLGLVFFFAAITIIGLFLRPQWQNMILMAQLVLLVAGLLIIVMVVRRLYREVLQPMDSLQSWASRMRQGDYSAEIIGSDRGPFSGLLKDLGEIGNWSRDLGTGQDSDTSEQLRQLARKTRSLEILYDVASSISVSRNLEDLLARFLQMLAEVVNAEVAVVRLTNPDGDMVLVDGIGVDVTELPGRVSMGEVIPSRGTTFKSVYVEAPSRFRDFAGLQPPDTQARDCVVIPLLYQGDVMGVYLLLADHALIQMREDLNELFSTVGYHLGMAIHKVHLDSEAQKQFLFRERLMLAHELHDSLAQSMASLRFQCQAMEESLKQSDLGQAAKEIKRLRAGVDRANVELRELLAHFRAPMDERGLVPAISDALKRFREDSGLLIFSQFDCEGPRPPMHIQRQVLRIVQEALANIRKHADAHIVRLMLSCDGNNRYRLLVEDDGHGFEETSAPTGKAGEHVGLTTMQERAEQIGAELNIESEPGEGTRVELFFSWEDSEAG